MAVHKRIVQPGPTSMLGSERSPEVIYRSLFIKSRGVLKKELTAHLRTKRQMRLAKGAQSRTGQGQILDSGWSVSAAYRTLA